MYHPIISLITCTKNSANFLADCLDSVAKQKYQNIEHIFIDAHSNDDTLDIIKNHYSKPIIYQQAGSGLYNAINLGITKATGQIIGILHADDMFADPDCLVRIVSAFSNNPDIGFYCAKIAIYDTEMNKCFAILGAEPHTPTFKEKLYSSNYFAHPTYYCSRKTIDLVGLYDEKLKIASDIDWLMRLESKKLKYFFDQKILIKFRSGSGISAKKYFTALKEEREIQKKYGHTNLSSNLFYLWHFLRRLTRYILEYVGAKKIITFIRNILIKFSK